MKDHKKWVLFTGILGGVADALAITAVIWSWNIDVVFVLIACFIPIVAIFYVYGRYKERCNLINYVEYLLFSTSRGFNLLPQICLALDKTKEYNPLIVRDMKIEYICDLSDVDTAKVKADTLIDYRDIVEYTLTAENNDLPKEFVCYSVNAYAKDMVLLEQKHGIQTDYKRVPPSQPNEKISESATVQRHCWQLNRSCIADGTTVPISFRRTYTEKLPANSKSTTILYPIQYAKKIENISFQIRYKSHKTVLNQVNAYKIWKDGETFKQTPVPDVRIRGNKATIDIKPECTKYEAYYLEIWHKLV